MSLYARLAWRNIFRNKRRTYITGIAIAIGLAALIFLDAIYIGMANNMIAPTFVPASLMEMPSTR